MKNEACECGHSRGDHVIVHIKPGGMDDEITGQILKCTQCLCQGFAPAEQPAKPEPVK